MAILTPQQSQTTSTATGPTRMKLEDYDRWMTELSNQQALKQNPEMQFIDPTRIKSWTSWIGGRQRVPLTRSVGTRYGTTDTWVDPTTGGGGGTQYNYPGVSYRPQTGNQAQDWVAENMAHGIQPKSDWAKYADTYATGPSTRLGGSGIQYNPGKTSMWSDVTQDQLGDTSIVDLIRKGYGSASATDRSSYQTALNKVSPNVMQKVEGSSYSLNPDVLKKMWR
jgi:hypothetical protein